MRQGYHAFRPSKSSVTRDLHLNANPIKGAHGAGLLSAEEMTSKQAQKQTTIPITPPPTPQSNGQSIVHPQLKRGTPTASPMQGERQFDPNNKNTWKRYEAGSIVASIPKDLARERMRKAGLPTDDRTVRRHFIKQLYPFNTRKPSRR